MSPERRLVEKKEKHLGREFQLDLRKLEHIATPLTQLTLEWHLLGSLQKY